METAVFWSFMIVSCFSADLSDALLSFGLNTVDLSFKVEGKVNFHLTAEISEAGACATNARSPGAVKLTKLTSVNAGKTFNVTAADVTLKIPSALCPRIKCLKICVSREDHATYVGKNNINEVICKGEDITDKLQCSAG
jgi:hypothetical protein